MESVYRYLGHRILIEDVQKAEGAYIYDKNGKKYVDMESGVWCVALGHCNPAVNEALTNQMNKLMHAGYAYTDAVVAETADKLLLLTEMPEGKCMFLSSGSEAVESGAQIMKKISDKKLLMTFADSFLGSHGSVAHKNSDEWFLFDWNKCAECKNENCEGCSIVDEIPFGSIAGFIFEPGSASGLVKFPPEKLISEISKRLKSNGGYFMVNEVTTGIGRTGKMFGYEHYRIKPDIVAVGKGIGNGFPVSCVIMDSDVSARALDAGVNISQSHQNDPSGAAVASAVLKELEDKQLIANSENMGKYLYDSLSLLKEKYGCITDIRGRGLMLTVTFDLPDDKVKNIFLSLFDQGYIVVNRPVKPVLRIDPPLIITKEDIDGFLEAFEKSLVN